mmetsp:Transcript_5262/g.12644  ORF Transcript_5262/g.12644 Transcript_5262/m.12644 type:complete len:259 (+) Transcript_5262:592-1368(+)
MRTLGHVCITELVDHIMEASTKVMAGTEHAEEWVFYHDALVQLTDKDTISWMADPRRDFLRRWLVPRGGLNDIVKGETKNGELKNCFHFSKKPLGDSPEMMPLDCSLNKDADDKVKDHINHTKDLDLEDERKFDRSTPNRQTSAYLRLLDPIYPPEGGALTSARIIQDSTDAWASISGKSLKRAVPSWPISAAETDAAPSAPEKVSASRPIGAGPARKGRLPSPNGCTQWCGQCAMQTLLLQWRLRRPTFKTVMRYTK